MKTYISVATYNEKENIEKLIQEIFALNVSDLSVVVVDDNSPDKTADIVEGLKNKFSKLHLIKRQGKLGYGSAHIAGFKKALSEGADIVISMDADLSHSPEKIPAMISEIENGSDVVVGSRRVKGGKIAGWNVWRHFCSTGAMLVSQFALGIKTKDLTSGFRAYRRLVLEKIDLDGIKSNGYSFLEELIYKIEKSNFKIQEIPITFKDRKHGYSKLSKKEIVKFFITIFKLKFKDITLRDILSHDLTKLYVLATLSLVVAYTFVKYPLVGNGDLRSYMDGITFFLGEGGSAKFFMHRVLTSPLLLLSCIVGGLFVPDPGDYRWVLFGINIILYYLIIKVFYDLIIEIYRKKKIAFIATILFIFHYCVYSYGTTFRADMSGWFFFLLTILFAVKFYRSGFKINKYYWLAIASSAIGILFKENGGVGILALLLLILFSKLQFRERIKKVFIAGTLFILPFILYNVFVYFTWDFSYFDIQQHNYTAYLDRPADDPQRYDIVLMIKVIGWLFFAGWPFFFWGLWQEYKSFNWERFKLLIFILVPSLTFLAWLCLTQRIAFTLVPWLIMITAFGLSKIKNNYLLILILLYYIIINYLIRNQSVPDLLRLINL